MAEGDKFMDAFRAQLDSPNFGRAAKALSNSIARGTQHFDRDHTAELFRDCICGKTIDPACPLHSQFLESS